MKHPSDHSRVRKKGRVLKKSYRIVIAEDHRILREGLRSMLSSNPAIEIVGEAENGLEAIRCANELKPDFMLLDLSMPKMNGIDAISEIKNRSPEIKIMILTVHKDEEYVFESLKAGADGYLLKDATRAELMLAVESVIEGKTYITPGISENLIKAYIREKPATVRTESSMDKLTSRERQILKLIAEGYQNKKIGDYLCISVKTVEKHRANLIKKLDLHNASELTKFAMEKGLVSK